MTCATSHGINLIKRVVPCFVPRCYVCTADIAGVINESIQECMAYISIEHAERQNFSIAHDLRIIHAIIEVIHKLFYHSRSPSQLLRLAEQLSI